MSNTKPLKWTPKPGIGYTVQRRADGGMQLTFSDLSEATLNDWREFALAHLFDSDRLTRNLYDLRSVPEIPQRAIQFASEVNSDPAARNVRAAVVVANEQEKLAIQQVVASGIAFSAAVRVFSDMEQAEEWLSRPLDQIA